MAKASNSVTVKRAPKDGEPGKDGVSPTLVSSATYYAYSDSGTEQPADSEFKDTIEEAKQAHDPKSYPWLWQKVVQTYSDNKTSTSYTVTKNGEDGEDGEDGVSVVSWTTSYGYSSSESSTPTTWYDTIYAASQNNPTGYMYLWTRVVQNFSNGTTSAPSYTVSRQGDRGETGLQGCITTTTEFALGTLYRNDYGMTSDEIEQAINDAGVKDLSEIDLTPQVHRVTIMNSAGGLDGMYICKQTHVSDENNMPGAGTSQSYECWEQISTQNPTYFPSLFADNAVFRFAQANQIIVVSGTSISAGMSGATDKKDIVFWAGGNRKEGEATWLVRRDGSGYAAGGAINFNSDGTITANGSNFSISTSGSASNSNWGTLDCFTPNYTSGTLIAITPNKPLTTLEINDSNGFTTDEEGRNTISIGKGMQIFANSGEYFGVISFNRRIKSGTLLNSSYYGFQLSNHKGNLLLSRWNNTSNNATGGKVGIFTAEPSYPFHVADELYADKITTPSLNPTELTIGNATLTWDSDNNALRVSGGSIIADNDVIALGMTTSSGLKTISVETVRTDNALTLYSDSTLTIESNDGDIKIATNDDVFFSSQNNLFNNTTLSTIISKINELAKAAGKTTI